VHACFLDLVRPHDYPLKRRRPDLLFTFGKLWYAEPNAVANAIGYVEFYSRSHEAVIRVSDAVGNVIETHEHADGFREP
jgi:hypothetical protein